MYPLIFPQLPCEVISLILSFSEDGAVISHYRHGQWGHRIQWASEKITQIESMLLIRYHFNRYWYHDVSPEYKDFYRVLKSYLTFLLRHKRDDVIYLLSE